MLKILKKINLKITAFFLLFVFFLPLPTSAATLYFNPSVGSLGPDNTFALDILLDVDACINAIEADIGFPNNYIQLQDFIIGESIFPIWVKRPSKNDILQANESGILNFIGGVPGGYCGKIPGDPGNSNTVARLIFRVSNLGIFQEENPKINILFLPNTKVLLNDGLGTSDNLTVKIASFNYTDKKIDLDNSWLKQINNDIIPPEPFIVELRQNKNMFDNQYYIIFNTIDKQSGMDHFEVLEIRPDQELGVIQDLSFFDKLRGKKSFIPQWKKAQIPYLLEDQDLLSIIRVKAIDKAGNERFVEYIPSEANRLQIVKRPDGQWIIIVGLAVFLFVLLLVLAIFIKKIFFHKENK